jgi:hypothetical protein
LNFLIVWICYFSLKLSIAEVESKYGGQYITVKFFIASVWYFLFYSGAEASLDSVFFSLVGSCTYFFALTVFTVSGAVS